MSFIFFNYHSSIIMLVHNISPLSDQTPVKHSLPPFPFDGLHAQGPHDLSNGHSRIFSILISPLGVAVKVFLEAISQINFVGKPRVDGTPVRCFCLLIVPLLDDT